jgi:transglutaminase superfamily protein
VSTMGLVFAKKKSYRIIACMIHGTTGLLYSAPLRGGDDGTEQTISMLRRLVDDAWKDSSVNRAAIEIIRNSGVAPYDSFGQVQAIYNFAHSFYFVNDPVTKEALRPTRELLQLMAGDCDDINGNVLPALLGTVGYETRLVTIAADPSNPDAFTHVYAEVFLDGEWIPLDAAAPGSSFGVAPKHFFRREWWSLVDGSHGDYSHGDSAMAGYAPVSLRGLGSIATDLSQAGAALSESGQVVQSALQPAIGPGGANMVSLPAATIAPATIEKDIFILLGAGLFIWLLAKN